MCHALNELAQNHIKSSTHFFLKWTIIKICTEIILSIFYSNENFTYAHLNQYKKQCLKYFILSNLRWNFYDQCDIGYTNLLLFFFGHGKSYTLSQSKCWRLRLGQREWLGGLDPLLEKSIQYMHHMYKNRLFKKIKICTHVFLTISCTKKMFDSISWWCIDCIWCQWWCSKIDDDALKVMMMMH